MLKMYKVFIVDDEPFIIEGLYDILDWPAFGLEIVGHAENGRQALDALQTTPADVLITDISMPVMNGLTLISEARKRHKDLKAIILSGFNEFDYLKEGMRLGIENYLLKPINVEELESTLRNTVEKLDSQRSEELYDAYDVQILKDNTLYRWLTGQIAAREFAERAELLNLSLIGPFIAVAVLRTGSGQNEAFEETAKLLEAGNDITPFRDVDGDIVLIGMLGTEDEGKRDFLAKLRELKEALAARNIPVQIGVAESAHCGQRGLRRVKKAPQAIKRPNGRWSIL